MGGAVPPLPQYAFMAWCSGGAQGQLYLLLLLKYFHGPPQIPSRNNGRGVKAKLFLCLSTIGVEIQLHANLTLTLYLKVPRTWVPG